MVRFKLICNPCGGYTPKQYICKKLSPKPNAVWWVYRCCECGGDANHSVPPETLITWPEYIYGK